MLADKAMGKAKSQVVPYRNSNLTRILQNALGGNSKTIMVCAISPASMNCEESMSTLRYADRAKKIQNKAVINESAQDKLIRELKSENEKLKELLKTMSGGGSIDQEMIKESLEGIEHAEQQLADVEDFDTKLAKQKAEDETVAQEREVKKKSENKSAPHLTNLAEDQQISQKTYYQMKECKCSFSLFLLILLLNIVPIRVGRADDQPSP